MKKWIKNNKGLIIMGSVFVLGSVLTVTLVSTMPNYILTSIDVVADEKFPVTGIITGTAGQPGTEYIFSAIAYGKKIHGGKEPTFYMWSLQSNFDDEKVPDWMTVRKIFQNGKGTNQIGISWTNKCIKSDFQMWLEVTHLDITGKYYEAIDVKIS